MSRSGMKPVYVGDVGEIHLQSRMKELPDVDYDSLELHELFAIAIDCNVDIKLFIGIRHCYMHQGMIAIGGRELPPGFNLIEHIKYCHNCYEMFRPKKLPYT